MNSDSKPDLGGVQGEGNGRVDEECLGGTRCNGGKAAQGMEQFLQRTCRLKLDPILSNCPASSQIDETTYPYEHTLVFQITVSDRELIRERHAGLLPDMVS
jgi:hypothetical protein